MPGQVRREKHNAKPHASPHANTTSHSPLLCSSGLAARCGLISAPVGRYDAADRGPSARLPVQSRVAILKLRRGFTINGLLCRGPQSRHTVLGVSPFFTFALLLLPAVQVPANSRLDYHGPDSLTSSPKAICLPIARETRLQTRLQTRKTPMPHLPG